MAKYINDAGASYLQLSLVEIEIILKMVSSEKDHFQKKLALAEALFDDDKSDEKLYYRIAATRTKLHYLDSIYNALVELGNHTDE